MNANEHDHRLEEVAAFALGALDADRMDDFREHLDGCGRCQEDLRRLEPAVRALPETVEQQTPPPQLKVRLMEEVRGDVATASPGKSFREWLRGVRLGGLTSKPLAAAAAVILIVAAGVGYLVGSGGGSNVQTTEVHENGIVAKVVDEDGKGELRLTGIEQPAQGKVLEAWVARGESVEPVKATFTPDEAGNAATPIENLKGVDTVMVTEEPAGGTKLPTTEPLVNVPLEGT